MGTGKGGNIWKVTKKNNVFLKKTFNTCCSEDDQNNYACRSYRIQGEPIDVTFLSGYVGKLPSPW